MSENKFIPDYSKYSTYQLVDVFTRIDKRRYPENVKLLSEQIHIKLNIDQIVDLESKVIQKKFKKILKEQDPQILEEKENFAFGKKLSTFNIILFLISLAFYYLYRETHNSILMRIFLGIMTLGFVFEITQSFFTNEINLRVTINKRDKPITFRIAQFMFAILAITLLIFLIFK